MANSKGIITRKDVIEDEAINWGPEYAKQTQIAIDKNKEFVKGVLEIAAIQKLIKDASNNSSYIKAKEREIEIGKATTAVWKEQIAAENMLISLKRKNELATESTNKAVIKERVALAETTKELKYQARERLGMVSAYEKLNRARLEAQKRLAELLSAEKKNIAEIILAQREFDKLDVRVKAVDAAIKNYSKNIGNYQDAFKDLNATFRDLMSTFGLVTGLALFGQIVKDIFSVVKDFDRQLIAVGKTTNISGEDLKQFGREVVELGDRLNGVTVDGLIKSAEVAGQLGVTGTANILKFSEAIEKLKLTSDIVSDEQVEQFAKFIEVSSDGFENADRLASVITQLGNSFATTEKQVLANATEIQKGVAVYKTSAEGVLALGAATSSLGSESEVSASSIQKTFGVINKAIATGKNLEKVLKLTGLTQKELSDQFNQDATGVFVKFIKGLNTAKKEGQNLSIVLGELGLDEVRSFKTIGSLAANYDLLHKSMVLAKQEYIDNIALNKEVEAASESLASILSDIRDRWEAYILSADDANSGTASLAKTLKFVRDNLKEIIDFVVKFGTVLLTYIGIMKTVNFVTTAWTAIQTAATAGQIRFALATGIGTESILAQAAAAKEATIAQEGLNIAVKATPWGLILGFLSAAVVAYMVFNDEMTDAEKNIQKIVDANKELERTEKKSAGDRDSTNSQRFKHLEKEIELRRAQGENSDKLDKEEIARKKEILQASLDVYSNLKKVELERTQTEINSSRQRIAQFELEKNALEKSGFRVSKQGRTSEELEDLIKGEKENRDFKKASLTQNSKLATDEQARLNKQLQDLDQDAAVKDAAFKRELSEKEKNRIKKWLKDRYELEKKALEDLFKLEQFRFQVSIDMDEEILNNEKISYDNRLDALYDSIQLREAMQRNAAEFELSQLGKYNEKTGKLVRELSDFEIKTLLEGGDIKKKLTAGQLLILEKFQDDQKKLTQKGVKDSEKLKKEEADKLLSEFKKGIEDLKVFEEERNKIAEVQILNQKKRLAKGLINQEEYEKEVLKIQQKATKLAIEDQLNHLQNQLLLLANTDEKKLILQEEFLKLKHQLEDEDLNKQIADNEKLLNFQKEKIGEASKVISDAFGLDSDNLAIFIEGIVNGFKTWEDAAKSTVSVIQDITNSMFDSRIQKIEEDQAANDEYYAKQIELAKNDERQKDLLQKERDKKNDELEKKKRKEQHKQAVLNKALAVVQVGISTAQGIMQSYAQLGPIAGNAGALLVGILGAIQTAAILAAPIPKYKDGRKGGKKEVAMINDGGVTEVVERKGGKIEMFSGKDRIIQLYEGDTVHKSVGDYNKLQRAAMMSSLNMEGRKMSDFQASQYFEASYGKELVEEMKLTRKAIQNQKQPIYKQPKIDIPHAIWRSKNTSWN